MSDPIAFNRLVDRIQDLGERPRYSGGKMRVRGICHDARGLDAGAVVFARGNNGGVVVYCHVCKGNQGFLDAIGWTEADLYDEPLQMDRQHREPRPWVPCQRHGHQLSAEYIYRDEHGDTVHGVTRCDHKCFAQWRPDGTAKSGRRWSLNDQHGNRLVQLVPYRLPELLAAVAAEQVVWICEGEKDVHALVDRGHAATCNAGGAGRWTAEHARHLRGADVTIVADRDRPGRDHAVTVVETLRGVARSVYVVQARHGKDAADHFAGGGTIGDFVQVWDPIPFTAELVGAGR